MSIWREISNGSGTYDRVDGIELGRCGSEDPAPPVAGMSGVYECTLPPNERVSVQPGDVIGIELPRQNEAKFRLYFDSTNNAPTNYVFSGYDTTVSLSQAISSEQDQPQVSLTVELDNIIPVLPTTQPLTTTEASSTMADHPTTLPLTSTSMATIYTTETPSQSTTDQSEAPTTSATNAPTTTEDAVTEGAVTEDAVTEGAVTEGAVTEGAVTDCAVTDPQSIIMGPSTSVDLSAVTDEAINALNTTRQPTAVEDSTTTSDFTVSPPREDEAIQPEGDASIGTIAGAAVGAIIAVLLVLIIILLVLVLRRQNRNGKKFTPSSNANIVNATYINGKPIVQDSFHF